MRRVLTAAVAVAALVVAGPVTTASAAPAPGAAGIGDSLFPDYGNGGYDVGHYDIRIRYFSDTGQLTGTTTILATATQDLSQFDLDFALTVSSVRVNNRAATFTRQGDHELVVTPARTITAGQDMTIVVQYSGFPAQVVAAGFTAWTRTADGALAVGEPEIAWWWFPSNDHPLDKATYDIGVLVPNGLQVISNGRQPSAPVAELTGWTRWFWRVTKPQPTYLTSLAIGHYDINNDVAADGTPIVTAYSDQLGAFDGAARASVERTNEIVEWETGIFGPWPWEAQGGVVLPPNSLGFALESASRPFYDGAFWRRGGNTSVVAHENAHQWFGDSVSVADWRNIWLNEGFARYTEWLWSEHEGTGTAQEVADFTWESRPADSPFWQITIGNPTVAQMFNIAVYDRGALTLQALRLAVGDVAFFTILRTWAGVHAGGNGTIEQFIALSQAISGKDLTGLFDTWLFSKGRPAKPTPAGLSDGRTTAAVGAHQAASAKAPKSWPALQESLALETAGR